VGTSKMKILSAFRRTTNETTDDPVEPESQREQPDEPEPQEEQQAGEVPAEQLRAIPLNQLERNPSQPRSVADEEKLEELITAILQEGLIQPIAVHATSHNSYQIVAGHRRVAAFQRLYERTKGTESQRQYEAIPAIVKAPLDDLRMATTSFIENDQREKLNLVDEAAALTKIRDILSARLSREATAKDVADAVGKKDEQRVGRLFRFHEAPDVVKEGVIGQRLVPKNDTTDGTLLAVVKTSTKGQKTIDLIAALEFCRLHKYFAASAPAKADGKTKRIIDRAREEDWSLRRIQGYVKAIVSGTAKLAGDRPAFSHDAQRLTLYLPRLASASAEARSELRLRLKSVLDELDRLEASSGTSNASMPSA
jgi:ParB/RepB/Spo0J family partition protein